jgi:tetratricopeptide (TPR) repeat protein
MARSFLFHKVALATATAVLGASSFAIAQPALSTSGSAAPAAKQPESAEMEKAVQFLNQRNVKDAFPHLVKASEENPKLPSAYVMMYHFLRQVNQGNAARSFLEQAVLETPSDPEPWVLFGEIALGDKRLAESEIDFAKANQLLKTYANEAHKPMVQQQALSGMASVAESRQRWELAQQRLEDYLKNSPDDLVAWQRLARAKFWQKNVTAAFQDLTKAKKIDVENTTKDPTHKAREQMLPPYAIIAQYYDVYERAPGKYVKSTNAESAFKTALQRAPDDLNLRAVVAVWALENGELPLAKEQAKEALRIEKADMQLPPNQRRYPNSTVGRMLSGFVAIWDKKWADAQSNFQDILVEAPNDFAAKNNLALALAEQDDKLLKDRALEHAQANFTANKDNERGIEAASTLAWVYFRLERFELATQVMELVGQKTGGQFTNPDTITYVAYIMNHNGLKYKAKQVLEGILSSGKPFSMKPEAQKLYDLVKEEKAPETSTPTSVPNTALKSP